MNVYSMSYASDFRKDNSRLHSEAGPGDPKLLTIKAKECLERADAVFYDALSEPHYPELL